jgi:hypothetical protein
MRKSTWALLATSKSERLTAAPAESNLHLYGTQKLGANSMVSSTNISTMLHAPFLFPPKLLPDSFRLLISGPSHRVLKWEPHKIWSFFFFFFFSSAFWLLSTFSRALWKWKTFEQFLTTLSLVAILRERRGSVDSQQVKSNTIRNTCGSTQQAMP